MKANDFEMCGGGTPGRIHTVVCAYCACVHILSWVPSQLGCAKSEGGCGKIFIPFRIYANERSKFLFYSKTENRYYLKKAFSNGKLKIMGLLTDLNDFRKGVKS